MRIVVGLAVSQRHTYLFSAGDDKQVKCWDLEQNKVSFTFYFSIQCNFYCILTSLDILSVLYVQGY